MQLLYLGACCCAPGNRGCAHTKGSKTTGFLLAGSNVYGDGCKGAKTGCFSGWAAVITAFCRRNTQQMLLQRMPCGQRDIGSCSRKPFPGRKLFITRFFPMWSVSRWDSRVWIPGRDPGYQWDLWHRYFLRQTFPMKIPGCLSEISAANGDMRVRISFLCLQGGIIIRWSA